MYYSRIKKLQKSLIYLLFGALFFLVGALLQGMFRIHPRRMIDPKPIELPKFTVSSGLYENLPNLDHPLIVFPQHVENHLHVVRLFGEKKLCLVDGTTGHIKEISPNSVVYFTKDGMSSGPTNISVMVQGVNKKVTLDLCVDGLVLKKIDLPISKGVTTDYKPPEINALKGDRLLVAIGNRSYFVAPGQLFEIEDTYYKKAKVLQENLRDIQLALYDTTGVWKKEVKVEFQQESFPPQPSKIHFVRFRNEDSVLLSVNKKKMQVFAGEGFVYEQDHWHKGEPVFGKPFLKLVNVGHTELQFALETAYRTKKAIITVKKAL